MNSGILMLLFPTLAMLLGVFFFLRHYVKSDRAREKERLLNIALIEKPRLSAAPPPVRPASRVS